MTAEGAALLREAAARMRELADSATPGPWHATHDPLGHHVEDSRGQGRLVAGFGPADTPTDNRRADAAFIASMHPGIALAVADWLTDAARAWDDSVYDPRVRNEHHAYALAVARAFLGPDR